MPTLTPSLRVGGGWAGFRQVGTSPNELWQPLVDVTATTLTGNTITKDLIRARPFLTGAGGWIDTLG